MSNDENKESFGLWGVIKSFFNTISLKAKLIIGIIVGVFGFITFHIFQRKWNDRQILELELEKVRAEIEIEEAQKDIDINNEKLDSLQKRADEIKKEIVVLETKEKKRKEEESDREISNEELDEFFDDRGF